MLDADLEAIDAGVEAAGGEAAGDALSNSDTDMDSSGDGGGHGHGNGRQHLGAGLGDFGEQQHTGDQHDAGDGEKRPDANGSNPRHAPNGSVSHQQDELKPGNSPNGLRRKYQLSIPAVVDVDAAEQCPRATFDSRQQQAQQHQHKQQNGRSHGIALAAHCDAPQKCKRSSRNVCLSKQLGQRTQQMLRPAPNMQSQSRPVPRVSSAPGCLAALAVGPAYQHGLQQQQQHRQPSGGIWAVDTATDQASSAVQPVAALSRFGSAVLGLGLPNACGYEPFSPFTATPQQPEASRRTQSLHDGATAGTTAAAGLDTSATLVANCLPSKHKTRNQSSMRQGVYRMGDDGQLATAAELRKVQLESALIAEVTPDDAGDCLTPSKKRRILSQFDELQHAYLQMRSAAVNQQHDNPPADPSTTAAVRPNAAAAASVCDVQSPKGKSSAVAAAGPCLNAFAEVLSAATHYSKMSLLVHISACGISQSGATASQGSCNILSSIAFNQEDQLFATAGELA